jgi:hypothetical protein
LYKINYHYGARRYANGELTKALLLEETLRERASKKQHLRYRTTYLLCDRSSFIKVILPESDRFSDLWKAIPAERFAIALLIPDSDHLMV